MLKNKTEINNCVTELQGIITHAQSLVPNDVVVLESFLTNPKEYRPTFDNVKEKISNSSTYKLLTKLVKKHKSKGATKQQVNNAKTKILDFLTQGLIDGGIQCRSASFESFDKMQSQEFIIQTILADAVTLVVVGSFEDTFFEQYVIPRDEHGISLTNNIPRLHTGFRRNTDGTPSDFNKIGLAETYLDHTILAKEANKIYPNADRPGAAVFLADEADVPTFTKDIVGGSINCRPIKFSTPVDLIGISQHELYVDTHRLDHTDALNGNVYLGFIWFKLSLNGIDVVLKVDLTPYKDSLLTQAASGKPQDFMIVSDFGISIPFNNTSLLEYTGDMANFKAALLSVYPTGLPTVSVNFNLAATVNIESAVMRVDVQRAELLDVVDTSNNTLNKSLISPNLTITGLGYLPEARMSNSNMRFVGYIVDANSYSTHQYTIPIGSPLTTKLPQNADSVQTLEALFVVQKALQTSQCVEKIQMMEEAIIRDSAGNIPGQYPIGDAVTPYYNKIVINVQDYITANGGKDSAFEALMFAISAQGAILTGEILEKSGYLNALKAITTDIHNYDIITVGDPKIVSAEWVSGDDRTFGQGRTYIITDCADLFFRNKIYISFKLRDRSGSAHPLDFGAQFIKPSILTEMIVSRDSQNTKEVQTLPRVNTAAFLPVLGVIELVGWEALYGSN